jgi:hypothetical protein
MPSFSCVCKKLDSYFPHAMKVCTIQDSPKVHIFLSNFLLLKILNKRDFFDKMAKLTNMLIEHKA